MFEKINDTVEITHIINLLDSLNKKNVLTPEFLGKVVEQMTDRIDELPLSQVSSLYLEISKVIPLYTRSNLTAAF